MPIKQEDLEKEIVNFISQRKEEYFRHQETQEWMRRHENIKDAVNMKYRSGDQITRSGFYFAALRATRDGYKDSYTDIFASERHPIVYKARRGIDQGFTDQAQEWMDDTWEDIDGNMKWLGLMDDAVDYSMGVGYAFWNQLNIETVIPKNIPEAWGETIQLTEGMANVLDQPDFERINPRNYFCEPTSDIHPSWEGCLREWTVSDLKDRLNQPEYNGKAIQKIIDEPSKYASGNDFNFYRESQRSNSMTGESNSNNLKFPVVEYWGDIRGIKGHESDSFEYVAVTVGDQLIRLNINKFRHLFRPFFKVLLSPRNGIPQGNNILMPSLTHQAVQNLIMNLSIDDVIMRQHLGLAYWPQALKNPNDLLNPVGARGVVEMKNNFSKNFLPTWVAEGQSGTMRDGFNLLDRIDRNEQEVGLPENALGLQSPRKSTATEQNILANASDRKVRATVHWAAMSGLRPLARNITTLMLSRKYPQELPFRPEDYIHLWNNNVWSFSDAIIENRRTEAVNRAEFFNFTKDYLLQLSGPDGNMEHVTQYLKSLGRAKNIPAHELDKMFPERNLQVNTQPQPQPQPQPNAEVT